jgi:hypothetical protein
VSFEVSSLAKAEPFDPSYANDAQKLCGVMGADVKGGVGPFGLWVLASADLRERTAVFFRVFMDGYGKPKVLVCTDPTKYGQQTAHPIMSSISQKKKHIAHLHTYMGTYYGPHNQIFSPQIMNCLLCRVGHL